MYAKTKNFGEVTIDDDKIIVFEKGIIGFPELTHFALIYNEEKGSGSSIKWLQSMDNPDFAMPVMDPLIVNNHYNPEVEDELIKPLGELNPEVLLVLVTVTVPKQIKEITVNLKAPIVINAASRKAAQVIVEGDGFPVKYPIYEVLQMKKAEAAVEGGK